MRKRRYFLAALAMLICGIAGGLASHALTGGPSGAQGASAAADDPDAATPADFSPIDEECRQLLADPGADEAIAWLNDTGSNRFIAQWEKPEAMDMLRGFYAAGAQSVMVVETETVGDAEVASQFVIVLPADPAARARVFQKDADFESQYGSDPAPDIGQKYLHLTTD